MKKCLTLVGLLMVFALSFIILNGCADTKSVVKDEAVQEQKAATPQAAPATVDDSQEKERAAREAALKAQAEKDARAKKNAAALADLNIQNIYFDFDKSSVRPDAREILKADAEIFMKNADATIVVEGYCDERGTAEYNMALGERRAQATKQYLVNLGIPSSRIETISYGEEKPADPGHNEAAWAQNRRAQFLLK